MIVVDTNVIGYLFLNSPHSTHAEEALKKDSAWAAPLLWRSELRYVLTLYLRKGLLTLEDALQIMDEASRLLAGREFAVPSLAVLTLASQSALSAYDCEFVALAQDLGVPLVTVDRQILRDFPHVAVGLEAFVGAGD